MTVSEKEMRNGVVLLVVCCLGCASICADGAKPVPFGIPMRGQVLYPDGMPAVGATVVAATVCPEDRAHLVKDVKTRDDGSFSIASFDLRCGRVRFTAEHREGYWLKTGDDVFYPSTNGTTPQINISGDSPPPPVTIFLGARGGEIEFQVWDEATDRFIYAGLAIEREPVDGRGFGLVSIATGDDGSSHTLFLPGGQYRVSVTRYLCGPKTFFVATRVWESFEVTPGQKAVKKLAVNTFNIKASDSYDNPSGQKCRP